jgi:hypothetical protein
MSAPAARSWAWIWPQKGKKSAPARPKSIETAKVVSHRDIRALSGVRFAGFEHHPQSRARLQRQTGAGQSECNLS